VRKDGSDSDRAAVLIGLDWGTSRCRAYLYGAAERGLWHAAGRLGLVRAAVPAAGARK
jgi:2-keto-3-deoxy-galactonokinase